MTGTYVPSAMLVFALAITIPSCKSHGKDEPAPAVTPQAAEHDHEEHASRELSDLDRPVEELLRLTCEHQKKTFECDECRYEVGVVRANASMLEGGLFKTVKAEKKQVAVPISLTGEVRFDERRIGHVSSQVEGVIKKVHVALGQVVRTGQPLLELESVAVGDAQASYLETEAMLQLARQNFDRVSSLRQEGIASEKEFLQAKQELETAEIRVRGSQGKLNRLGTNATQGRLVLRAPVDGTILLMHAVSGEFAKPAESLLTVGDNGNVWVWADLYERDIAAVKLGQSKQKLTASIQVKAYPGDEFPGTVELVGPAMDESSRTVKVRIEAKNVEGRLLSGMFATAKIFLPSPEESLTIARDAVLEDEGRSFVFVHHHDDYYIRRPVTVGRSWPGVVEVKKGLEPAQLVVAEGAFLMKSDVLRSKMGAGCAD